jgi:hypothetical protein
MTEQQIEVDLKRESSTFIYKSKGPFASSAEIRLTVAFTTDAHSFHAELEFNPKALGRNFDEMKFFSRGKWENHKCIEYTEEFPLKKRIKKWKVESNKTIFEKWVEGQSVERVILEQEEDVNNPLSLMLFKAKELYSESVKLEQKIIEVHYFSDALVKSATVEIDPINQNETQEQKDKLNLVEKTNWFQLNQERLSRSQRGSFQIKSTAKRMQWDSVCDRVTGLPLTAVFEGVVGFGQIKLHLEEVL